MSERARMNDDRHGYSGCSRVHQPSFHRTSSPIASQSRPVRSLAQLQSLAFDALLIHRTAPLMVPPASCRPVPSSVRHALIIQRRKATEAARRRSNESSRVVLACAINARSVRVSRALTVAARSSKCPSRQLDPAEHRRPPARRGRQSESNSRK